MTYLNLFVNEMSFSIISHVELKHNVSCRFYQIYRSMYILFFVLSSEHRIRWNMITSDIWKNMAHTNGYYKRPPIPSRRLKFGLPYLRVAINIHWLVVFGDIFTGCDLSKTLKISVDVAAWPTVDLCDRSWGPGQPQYDDVVLPV